MKRATLGAISVTNPSATPPSQVSSVIVNASVDVSVSVEGSTAGLGVDWSLICGGSAVAGFTDSVCGTITPAHEGSNISMVYKAPQYVPIGNTVTLTAAATSDPSESVSVTVTILPQPVAINFSLGLAPPSQMAKGGTASIAANILYDPLSQGVKWTASCGSASCGSFNPTETPSGTSQQDATLYTAPSMIPSGGSVTITATSVYDPTKSVSMPVQIMPISVGPVTISSPVVPPGGIADTLTATVSWDVAHEGVNWSISCAASGSCGSVDAGTCASPVAGANSYTCTTTYISPDSFPVGATALQVSVIATSATDSTQSGTGTLTIGQPPPITVSLGAPNPPIVQLSGKTSLTATINYDFSKSGVNWACNPASACVPQTMSGEPLSGVSATYTTSIYLNPTIPAGQASVPVTVIATSNCLPATVSNCSSNPPSGSATVTVNQPISVIITQQQPLPPSAISAGQPATFSATVSNDIAPGGVDWSASGCPPGVTPCGTFSPAHTASGQPTAYTLRPNIVWPTATPTVTITATSTASETAPPLFPSPGTPPGQTDPVQVSVTPATFVEFVPFAPSTLPVGSTTQTTPTLINLVAAAVNDPTNQGVDWTVTCPDQSAAACGQFMTAPGLEAPKAVTGAASTPPVFAAYGTKVHAANGQAVVFEPPTQMPTGKVVTLAATSTSAPTASASQDVSIANSLSGPALSGYVMAGNLPVAGATVSLFAAGNECYGSAYGMTGCSVAANDPLKFPDQTSSVVTGSNGSFTIPAGYQCANLNTLVYLVATGGTPQGQKSPNAQLGLMTAVGPCSILNGSTTNPLFVNEVTTVASAFALAPFTQSIVNGGSYTTIGASSANYNNGPNLENDSNYNNGLANAFVTVNNLVDITTGQALSVTPAGNGTPPQAEINTLADAMDTCAASAGLTQPGDGSACDFFLQASNTTGGITIDEPATTLQAIFEIAQAPGALTLTDTNFLTSNSSENSGEPLYTLATNPSFNPPFTPTLTDAPYDWSMAITYTGGGLEGQSPQDPLQEAGSDGLALDASGNVWIINKRISSVTELSNTGAALSPWGTGKTRATAGGFKGGGLSSPLGIAVDPFGDAWILDPNSTVSELGFNGAPLSPASGFSGGGDPSDSGTPVGGGIAIDGTGNVWVVNGANPVPGGQGSGDIAEYAGYNGGTVSGVTVATGAPLSPVSTGGTGGGYENGINGPNGAIAVANQLLPPQGQPPSCNTEPAVWVLNQGNYSAAELGSTGQLLDTDYGYLTDQTGKLLNPLNPVLQSGQFGLSMAIDNSGDIFIPNPTQAGTTSVIYELLDNCSSLVSSANQGGIGQEIDFSSIGNLKSPIAIDGAGHIWMVADATTVFPVKPVGLEELTSTGSVLNSNYTAQGYFAANLDASVPTGNLSGLAVDASGNVWALSGSNPSTVTEFVGVAVPVVTPLSVAAQKNKLGSEP